MPVYAERISQPSPQDLIDLEKVYDGETSWLSEAIAGPDLFIGGRFNGRLVAACTLRNKSDHWQLEKLQVRDITRRRGVAYQMLNSLQQSLDIDRPIQVDLNQHPELKALFEKLGFTGTADQELTLQWQP